MASTDALTWKGRLPRLRWLSRADVLVRKSIVFGPRYLHETGGIGGLQVVAIVILFSPSWSLFQQQRQRSQQVSDDPVLSVLGTVHEMQERNLLNTNCLRVRVSC